MPRVLSAEQQSAVTSEWVRAFTPPDNLSGQQLLDLLLVQHAYQLGVDRIAFRAEKDLPSGRVVIELETDSRTPDQDLLVVTLLDVTGSPVRSDRYTRAEVERAQRELGPEHGSLMSLVDSGQASPKDLARFVELDSRLKAAARFPIAAAALSPEIASY